MLACKCSPDVVLNLMRSPICFGFSVNFCILRSFSTYASKPFRMGMNQNICFQARYPYSFIFACQVNYIFREKSK